MCGSAALAHLISVAPNARLQRRERRLERCLWYQFQLPYKTLAYPIHTGLFAVVGIWAPLLRLISESMNYYGMDSVDMEKAFFNAALPILNGRYDSHNANRGSLRISQSMRKDQD